MLIELQASSLSGQLSAPPSKSHSIRAILLACLAAGDSELQRVLYSEDIAAALTVAEGLGVKIYVKPSEDFHHSLNITVRSSGYPFVLEEGQSFYTAQSGITTSFLLPLLALQDKAVRVDCDEQMKKRPLLDLIQALRTLGAQVDSDLEGYAPLTIRGPIHGGSVQVEGKNSQVVSALLMALPLAPDDSILSATDLQERPYVSMTETYLEKRNIKWSRQRDSWTIPGGQTLKTWNGSIPGDFSSAAALIAAAVLKGSLVKVKGLDTADGQADKALIPLLQAQGADLEWKEDILEVRGGNPLRGASIDCSDFPDLVPILAVLATQATSRTVLKNVEILRAKESDRLEALCSGLGKMGGRLQVNSEGLCIEPSPLFGADLTCFGDHRMAMAFAVAALCATGKTRLEGAECVAKTFPRFFDSLLHLGATLTPSH